MSEKTAIELPPFVEPAIWQKRYEAGRLAGLREAAEAREWLSNAINALGDPCDACDFDGDEAAALKSTIGAALSNLEKAAAILALAEGGEHASEASP